jgi:hypothetical protein
MEIRQEDEMIRTIRVIRMTRQIATTTVAAAALLLVGSPSLAQTERGTTPGSTSPGTTTPGKTAPGVTAPGAPGTSGAASGAASGMTRPGAKAGDIQSSGRSYEGTVQKSEQVGQGQQTHQVILLQTNDGQDLLVDLGPQQALQSAGAQIDEGSQLDVTAGRYLKLGDRTFVVASTIEMNGKPYPINRTGAGATGSSGATTSGMTSGMGSGAMGAGAMGAGAMGAGAMGAGAMGAGAMGSGAKPSAAAATIDVSFQGEVVQMTTVDAGAGQKHRLVLLEQDDGERVPVDLGPENQTTQLSISQGQELSVTGRPMAVGDSFAIFANKVGVISNSVDIQRTGPGSTSPGSTSPGSSPGTSPSPQPQPQPGQPGGY